MAKISIIMPVYNVESYVEACIKSILQQSFVDFELIIVNDGSTDGSDEICREYTSLDNRVKFINKINGGLSDARNAGLNMATGEYIGFVDSDDIIDSKMYETLYECAKTTQSDIACCKMSRFIDNIPNNYSFQNVVIKYNSLEALKLTYDNKLAGYSVCNKLFKKELFLNLKFPSGRIFEDASILYQLIMRAKAIAVCNDVFYYYRIRNGSITRTYFNEKRFDIVPMFEEVYQYMLDNCAEMCGKIKELYYNSLRNIMYDIVYEGSIINNYKYLSKVSSLVKGELKYINTNKLISKRLKIGAFLIAYCPIIAIVLYIFKIYLGEKLCLKYVYHKIYFK